MPKYMIVFQSGAGRSSSGKRLR